MVNKTKLMINATLIACVLLGHITSIWGYHNVEPFSTDYYVECQQGTPPEPGSNSVCVFDVFRWGPPCSPKYGYGFEGNSRGPCAYLVFSNLPGWIPEYYNTSTLPTNMPSYLTNFIQQTAATYGDDSRELKIILASCEGKTATDIENIGPLQYFPVFGFDGRYFPVENKDAYINPVVAVRFENPKHGILINVECKAWARNLNHEKGEGVVHLELLVDY